jgi:hypothetical protein
MSRSATQAALTFATSIAAGCVGYAMRGNDMAFTMVMLVLSLLFAGLAAMAQMKELP